MFKIIVWIAAIVIITTQWNAFTEIVDLAKILEVTHEVITKVKE